MSDNCCGSSPSEVDFQVVEKVINNEYQGDKENLVMILQALQKEYNYLPKLALQYIATKLMIPLAQVYEVATFYTSFSLKPKGKHIIQVCTGTACHLKGSEHVVKDICDKLDIQPGDTTQDGNFTVETVNCVGACALAMVALVDEKYHADTSTQELSKVIESIS